MYKRLFFFGVGDLNGKFYKRLLKLTDNGAGYKSLELLTVHFAVMPRKLVYQQRKNLIENELHVPPDTYGRYQS